MSPLYSVAASLWRTVVPYLVSFAVVQLARLGLHIDDATLTTTLVGGFGTAYYGIFRALEERFGSRWGWALGLAKPPNYDADRPTT